MTDQERSAFIATSPLQGIYDPKLIANQPIEVIQKKESNKSRRRKYNRLNLAPVKPKKSRGWPHQSVSETLLKSAARTLGSQVVSQIIGGVLGLDPGRQEIVTLRPPCE